MNDNIVPLSNKKLPAEQAMLDILDMVDVGTEIWYTRRGLDRSFRATIRLVIEDAIVVTHKGNPNPMFVRIEAIDTLELIGEGNAA